MSELTTDCGVLSKQPDYWLAQNFGIVMKLRLINSRIK
jgi:hypothetical protein